MYSIGMLCKQFKLARSTLLYYDRIGLLPVSTRTDANYRLYSEEDKSRLSQICALREAGVALYDIKDILDNEGIDESSVLEKRLDEINREIRYLRFKQKMIVEIMKGKKLSDKKMLMDKEMLIDLFSSLGVGEKKMQQLHYQFEKNSPDSHQFFLEFLGLADEEIKHIREQSRDVKEK